MSPVNNKGIPCCMELTSFSSGASSSDAIFISSRHLGHWPQLYVTSSSSHIAMMIHFITIFHFFFSSFWLSKINSRRAQLLIVNCEATIACTRLQQGTDTYEPIIICHGRLANCLKYPRKILFCACSQADMTCNGRLVELLYIHRKCQSRMKSS